MSRREMKLQFGPIIFNLKFFDLKRTNLIKSDVIKYYLKCISNFHKTFMSIPRYEPRLPYPVNLTLKKMFTEVRVNGKMT